VYTKIIFLASLPRDCEAILRGLPRDDLF